ncbi:sugar ABC transporter permease [Candidatus Villigracilis affinis]|uniref:carbohydrate ABC transporter permease n=1 Tax=Candidatus Villigracilis affinis TaxID=3140682 RepID=UPI001D756A9A|nr:sugar ABC transporter permease [Anaerolineales bacterium]
MNRTYTASSRTQLLLMLTPYLLGAAVLVGLPALLSLLLAFLRYDGISAPVWVGGFNFQLVLANPVDLLFPISLYNTLYFVILAVPVRVLSALALALLLSRSGRGVGLYRAAVYLPTIIPDVAYALIWMWIFNPLYGPLNLILEGLGLPTPGWLADAQYAKVVFVVMAAFQIGEGFVVLLAGLQNIPPEYYAAAAVDGGNVWQQFRYITLPLLAPWLLLLTLRDIILSSQNIFTANFIMTNGDPYYSTLFLPLLIYEEAFDRMHFGPGSAMTVLLGLVTAALIGLILSIVGSWGETDAS